MAGMMISMLSGVASARVTAVRRNEANDQNGGDDRRGGEREDRGSRSSRGESPVSRPGVVIKMQRTRIPNPDRIRNDRHIVRDRTVIAVPRNDEHGSPISQQANRFAPRQHVDVIRNPNIIRSITREQRVEAVPNRYFWHNVGSIRYCHYYDHGIHWYGFYHGPTFYWTRYSYNRWWWFDAGFNRWVYWWNDYWWWPSPSGSLYVYTDNNYYPYEDGSVTVPKPEIQSPMDSAPSPTEGSMYNSPDGQRMVQIYGTQAEAFLYDKSGVSPRYLKYLGTGVSQVRFKGGTTDTPLQILIDYRDGDFAFFSSDGNPLDNTRAAADSSFPPMAPPQAPPVPTPGR